MTGGTNRAATVRAVIRGESASAFEAVLQEARTNAAGDELAINALHVATALKGVMSLVFPHRALETQRQWMQRKMFKPVDLSTRQTAAAINRLNNALPLFPGGSEDSKFSATEVVGPLEWSLPAAWRAKFDLDGYVPTDHPKTKLIEACEAIERNQGPPDKSLKTSDPSERKGNKNPRGRGSHLGARKDEAKSSARPAKKPMKECTEHGKNPTHDTSECWTLKNRAAKGSLPNKQPNLRTPRKELNAYSQVRIPSSAQALELYAEAVRKERAQAAKETGTKRSNDAISQSDGEVVLSAVPTPEVSAKSRSARRRIAILKKKRSETTVEETAYQKRLLWLEDHGGDTQDEPVGSPAASID